MANKLAWHGRGTRARHSHMAMVMLTPPRAPCTWLPAAYYLSLVGLPHACMPLAKNSCTSSTQLLACLPYPKLSPKIKREDDNAPNQAGRHHQPVAHCDELHLAVATSHFSRPRSFPKKIIKKKTSFISR